MNDNSSLAPTENPILVVFEGVDRSGKTTLSQALAKVLHYDWGKYPKISTEEADRLNDPNTVIDETVRESFFVKGMIQGNRGPQSSRNTVLDRYLWTGVAYAKQFSPSMVPFLRSLYSDPTVFKPADITIFLDTDPSVCVKRDSSLAIDTVRSIRNNFLSELTHLTPVLGRTLILPYSGQSVDQLVQEVSDFVYPLIHNTLRKSISPSDDTGTGKAGGI